MIMGLQVQIKKDLILAMKAKNEPKKNTLRVIIGEFGRLEKKDLNDDEVISVLKKLIKSEMEMLEKTRQNTSSYFIKIIESYLPKQAGDEEIRQWITDNVDLSQYKHKMQAMSTIMKHFGASANGNTVKKILQMF
jgi:uncharacterized protein YqeY